ncbi:hypothetical protein KCU65_g6606, partial [Aureobasidium melanogenum]
MAKQKQTPSATKASRPTKTTTKPSSNDLKKHNIQHLRLEISSLDSLTPSSTTNIDINDIIQTHLQNLHNKLRPHFEDLRLEMQSHFDRTNAHFDRMDNCLKGIDKKLDWLVEGMEKLKETTSTKALMFFAVTFWVFSKRFFSFTSSSDRPLSLS